MPGQRTSPTCHQATLIPPSEQPDASFQTHVTIDETTSNSPDWRDLFPTERSASANIALPRSHFLVMEYPVFLVVTLYCFLNCMFAFAVLRLTFSTGA